MPIKIFVAPHFSKEQDVRLLSFEFVQKVEHIQEADFIVVPQFVRRLDGRSGPLLEQVRRLVSEHHVPAIALKAGDLSYRFRIPGLTVFAQSLFRSRNVGEYAMPAPIEDLSQEPLVPRHKSEKPLVSFCGYAGLSGPLAHLKYLLKNAALSSMPAYRRGIYWRRRAMRALSADPRIDTHFIVRKNFSGKSGKLASEEEKREYRESIVNADFVLCPRGDGNYSARFYETLALGRIPILIDTDMVLPLEDTIDYAKFCIRVPYGDVAHIGEYVMKRWQTLSDADYIAMQMAAREAFQNYLRYEAFYKTILPKLKMKSAKR